MTLLERFMDKFVPDPNSGCWLWTATCTPPGYGQISTGHDGSRGHMSRAHRISWELFRGPIAKGFVVDHKCGVRCCVNPDHLRVVTQRENLISGTGRIADFARRTHCKNGHEYTEANTYRYEGKPWRKCRKCNAESAIKRWRGKSLLS